MVKKESFRPGQKVPKSGQYKVIDKKGQDTGREITCIERNTFPPSNKPGSIYILVDETKHQNDKE